MTAFWLNGSTLYPISRTHIRAVLDAPDIFCRDKTDLVATYKKHKEKIGFEGKARKEIIRQLVNEGWIRIRFYDHPERYLRIQCREPEDQKKEIEMFLQYAYTHLGIHEGDKLRIGP